MPRRKKKAKPVKPSKPYLSQPAMQKMAEGLFELVMGMVAGKDIITDNNTKEQHEKLNNRTHTDTNKSI